MIVTNMILTVILSCFVINISKYSEYFDNTCLYICWTFIPEGVKLDICWTVNGVKFDICWTVHEGVKFYSVSLYYLSWQEGNRLKQTENSHTF